MCTLQTGNLYYNAVSINYVLVLVYVQNCKRAQSPVCHGPSKKEFAVSSRKCWAQLCMLTQDKSTKL